MHRCARPTSGASGPGWRSPKARRPRPRSRSTRPVRFRTIPIARTIDLLGLNDAVIARGPLAGPFYPGHDKWNYDYSITQLKPDLIADNWIRLGDYMRDKTEYKQLDNGMYVRQDTTLVDVPALLQAFPR